MPLLPGYKLGPYEILAPTGAGGMGEVYRARERSGNRFLAESSCRAVLVSILESQNLRLFRVLLDGSPEAEVPADPAQVSGYSHLSPAGWNADGRLLTSLHDSWFAAPAVLDTGNGHVHPLPATRTSILSPWHGDRTGG